MDDSRNSNLNINQGTVPIRKKVPSRSKTGWLLIFVLLTFIFAGSTAYLAKENYALKNNPDKLSGDENKELVKRVGKLMILPSNEEPTVATVTDLSVLKDQPFFNRAQIGDKVLIYSVAKKAILFNPSENKVVEVAPINDTPVQPAPQQSTQQ